MINTQVNLNGWRNYNISYPYSWLNTDFTANDISPDEKAVLVKDEKRKMIDNNESYLKSSLRLVERNIRDSTREWWDRYWVWWIIEFVKRLDKRYWNDSILPNDFIRKLEHEVLTVLLIERWDRWDKLNDKTRNLVLKVKWLLAEFCKRHSAVSKRDVIWFSIGSYRRDIMGAMDILINLDWKDKSIAWSWFATKWDEDLQLRAERTRLRVKELYNFFDHGNDFLINWREDVLKIKTRLSWKIDLDWIVHSLRKIDESHWENLDFSIFWNDDFSLIANWIYQKLLKERSKKWQGGGLLSLIDAVIWEMHDFCQRHKIILENISEPILKMPVVEDSPADDQLVAIWDWAGHDI